LMIDMDGLVRQQLTLNVLYPGQTINAVAEQQTTMAVLPNPAGDHFRIQAEGIESAVVRTMDGRWVGLWAAGGLDTMEISSSGWPNGAYVIEVRTASGVLRSRVLVQH
ncbi:MAG: T9SS type A sorting domain-containing protein, partial [Flavobacteriales bacterium]|nr:T9SS type A sorting domain-containing protein [Flavobacteriales bacterium]